MTHRFLVAAIDGPEVHFSPEQARQLERVLRLRAGDRVRVFDGVTPCDYEIELVELDRGRVVGECQQAPEPRTRLAAYPALLQRDKFEPVLQKLTEIGVAAIAPVITARGLVRDAPDAHRLERWRSILREATEQCGRGRVPDLQQALRFPDAVSSASGCLILAYEGERDTTLRSALAGRPLAVSLFVGPEGGFTPDEIATARAAGARAITLGPRVLRTDTASPVLAALVLYELGDLSWPTSVAENRTSP